MGTDRGSDQGGVVNAFAVFVNRREVRRTAFQVERMDSARNPSPTAHREAETAKAHRG